MPEQKKAVVPRLRFPEFRDAGPWEVKRLGEIVEIINERAGDKKCTLLSVTAGIGLVSQVEKFGREIAGKQRRNYFILRKNDFAYNKSATKDYPEGYIGLYEGDEIAAVPNSIFVCFRPAQEKVVPRYLRFLFEINVHGRWLRRFITVGARAHGSLNIDNHNLLHIPIPLPATAVSIPEQQKIADCLSSLDELIELQAKQLEALQAHKKGLMQQLFPREGETTPRLRFPEFRDAGPWENIQVSDFGTIVTGKTPSTSNPKYWNGRFAWVTPTDISDTKYIYTTDRLLTSEGVQLIGVLPENTVLITCIASIGKNAILKVPGSCNQQINAIIPNSNFNSDFIYYLFCKNQTILQNQAGTSATAIIPKSAFEKFYFHVPKLPEQQKIADCLSSLDELIELQAKQLEALQAHKKGLMQQLFPQEIDL